MTELQDAIGVTSSMTPTTSIAPFTSNLTVSGLTPAWSEPLTVTADFGDGSTPVTVTAGNAPHVYSIPGVYTETTTVADSGGSTVTARPGSSPARQRPAASLAVGPFTYDSPAGVTNVMIGSATFSVPPISNQWELLSQNLSFGDGTSASLGTQSVTWSQMYPRPAIPGQLIDTDLLGRTSKASVTAVPRASPDAVNVPVRHDAV